MIKRVLSECAWWLACVLAIALVFGGATAANAATSVCSPPPGTVGLFPATPNSHDTIGQRTMVCATNEPGNPWRRDSCYRQFVSDDGIWLACQDWIADGGDPETPRPEQPCQAENGTKRWGGEEQQLCTTVPPGTIPVGHLISLPGTPHGGLIEMRDHWGPAVGYQRWQCNRGVWRLVFEACGYVK